VKKVVVKI